MITLCLVLSLYYFMFNVAKICTLKFDVDDSKYLHDKTEIKEKAEIEKQLKERESKTPSMFKKYEGKNIEAVFEDVLKGKKIFIKNSKDGHMKYFDVRKCEDVLVKYKYSTIKEIYMLDCWTNAIEIVIC